jgi:glycosyltransferase involved in cell wall biosynthesis
MLAQMLGWPDVDSDFYRVGTHMEACSLRLADAVYSSSQLSADWAAKECGLRRDDIPVLHVGVDTSLFYPRNVPKEERPTIIFVGKLVRNKGLAPLLAAACELAKEFPDLRLRVLGRGEKERVAEMRAEVAARGLDNLLDLPGYVHRQDLPEQLSRAHVFAAPSAYEGGPGFVYLEAMACGLPVIACSGSGAAEVIDAGNTGELVPADDAGSLLKVLRQFLADRKSATAMGERGRQYVREHADAQKCLDKLEAYYVSVIARYTEKQKVLAEAAGATT